MYNITKNGIQLSLEDNLVPVKLNRNNIYIPCELIDAEGVVIHNSYVEPIEGLEIRWLDGGTTIDRMNSAGAAAMQSLNAEPPKEAGIFTYDEWAPGKLYKQFENFTCEGVAGFARIEHTAAEHQRPFAEGMSAVYGARPPQDSEGVYAYVSSMKVDAGDKVRSVKDGQVYEAIQPADPLTFDPVDAVSIFVLI